MPLRTAFWFDNAGHQIHLQGSLAGQVLAEAAKILRKHFLTLESGITESQTAQMEASGLQLVVPQAIQVTYTAAQQGWLRSVAEFIEVVRGRW